MQKTIENVHSKVVIIGNGFDIECGLPTSYKAFLDFTKVVNRLLAMTNVSRALDSISETTSVDPRVIKMLRDDINTPNAYDDLTEWRRLIEDNWWIERFLTAEERDGWIDFETQLSRYVRAVEELASSASWQSTFLDDEIPRNEDSDFYRLFGIFHDVDYIRSTLGQATISTLPPAISTLLQRKKTLGITYRQLREKLVKDLDRLTLAFEKYLTDYVDKLPLDNISSCITKLLSTLHGANAAYVVSFNYTRTLERLYKRTYSDDKVTFCYIHGVIREDRTKGECNLVLGIDEYLHGADREEKSLLLPFRKYYRRMVRETDHSYLNWSYGYRDQYAVHQDTSPALIVFGHSLGKTDAEVFRHFIIQKESSMLCYYHDSKTHEEQVENLVRIIGADRLQERLFIPNPEVFFVLQGSDV